MFFKNMLWEGELFPLNKQPPWAVFRIQSFFMDGFRPPAIPVRLVLHKPCHCPDFGKHFHKNVVAEVGGHLC